MNHLLADIITTMTLMTGYPALDHPVDLAALPQTELAAKICPDNPDRCRMFISAYHMESRTIYYASDVDMDHPIYRSFVAHEVVHALQHQAYGDGMYDNCEKLKLIEAEAYRYQAEYIRSIGVEVRVQDPSRFIICRDDK